MKGDIYPNPELNHKIIINKFYYKHDDNFQLRMFISAQIIGKEEKEENSNSRIINGQILDFSKNNITKTLKNIFNITKDLKSGVFIVDTINQNEYTLKYFIKNDKFILKKKTDFLDYSLNLADIIYINDYYIEEENINLTQISFIEKLNDEKLFIILQEKPEISKNYLWGNIIEKDEKNKKIKIMDSKKDILTIGKYNDKIKLGQYFIFSNYTNKDKIIEFEEDKKNSFTYYSSQDLYFSNKIILNLYSVIQFYFIDFTNNDNNYYNEVEIENKAYEIKYSKMDVIFLHKTFSTYSTIIPIKIELIRNELDKKSFFVEVLQGFVNHFNTFINNEAQPSYYFEYLYIFFKEPKNLLNKNKKIKYKGKEHIITNFDNFESKNRIRFNILNSPPQKEYEKYKEKKSNHFFSSYILICETFIDDNDNSNIYGIFDICDIVAKTALQKNLTKIEYDSLYNNFGKIYDNMNNDKIENNQAIEFYEKYGNENDSLFFNLTFDQEITKSQLNIKMGILISHYFNINKDKKKFRKLVTFRDIQSVIKRIESIKDKFTNSQLLRIFSYLLRAKIEYKTESEILLLSEEKDDSAYLLAQNFIIEEIAHLNEFSKLFIGYLQMDSFVLYNFQIPQFSYSLSIEPMFIVKYHLKTNFEGFFILEEINARILGWTEKRENITIINEQYLFEKTNFKDPSHVNDKKELKNLTFRVTIVLRHENNSHKKKIIKINYFLLLYIIVKMV